MSELLLTANTLTEEWRPVVGWEGLYEVSNTGLVRSLDRMVWNGFATYCWKGRLLRGHSGGRPAVNLQYRDRKRGVQVGVLVLEAFVGPRPEGTNCCHWDGNPKNNCVSNLRWDTQSANLLDAVRHGTHSEIRKTHCVRGHEYTPENTRISRGRRGRTSRTCRACHQILKKKSRHKMSAARKAAVA